MREASAHPQAGFALLITITLVAFLVLLLVTLATFTRVETQVAGNNRHLAQARQQALMALDLALGRLQATAGPDQRASGTAELTGQESDGTRHWTGIWGNQRESADLRSEPKLLSWLVSGNETGRFSMDTTAGSFGRIVTADTPAFAPSDAVDLGSAVSAGALAADVTVQGRPAQLLVGHGSVEKTTGYVVAPLEEVTVPAGQLPGMPTSGATVVGRYAWWVGDEGVKAKVNTLDRWEQEAGDRQERFSRLALAQRSGIGLVGASEGTFESAGLYPQEGAGQTRDQLFHNLRRTLSEAQLTLGLGTDAAVARHNLRERRHDLTVHSQGVLADPLRGGLKRDLTALFETDTWNGSLAESLERVSYRYAGARRIADFQSSRLYGSAYSNAPGVGADARSPRAATWEQVRSYYRFAATNTGGVQVRSQTDDRMGISPLVLRWGIAFDASAAAGGGGTLHLFPHLVLWNPYNATLSGSYRVRIEFAATDTNNSTSRRLYLVTPRRDGNGNPIAQIPYTVYHQEDIAPERPGTGKYSQRTLEFALRPVDIPPGAAYVFTPEDTQAYQDSGDNWLANTYNTTRSFTRPIAHEFTPAQVEFTAIAIANTASTGSGGTMTLHLLDADPTDPAPLQMIDAPGLRRLVGVNANDGTATAVTEVSANGLGEFRDLAAGPVSSRNQVGFAFTNNLQQESPRYNWLAHVNQRAPSVGRTWFEWNDGFRGTANWSSFNPRTDRSAWDITLVSSSPARAYTGPRRDADGVQQAILFDLPRTDTPVRSLGQLQHAALSFTPAGQEPTYPFGNAYATPHIPQNRLLRPNALVGSVTTAGSRSEAHLTDVSYLLNRALWDRFFFSSVPNEPDAQLQARITAGEPLPNGRHRYREGATAGTLKDFEQAAAQLLVDGAFNVNSTSEEAWVAQLSSLRGVRVDPADGAASGAADGTPAVRTPWVPGGTNIDSRTDQWAGYRRLTDAQVRTLAQAVVAEVKVRGPFLSLADFVNRRLTDFPDTTGLSGTLQSALDRVGGLNTKILETDRPASDSDNVPTGTNEVWEVSGATYYLQNLTAPRRNTAWTGQAKAAMAPGFLSQADLLTALGPMLTARSDTFVIRAYGETVNALLDPGDAAYINGRAWCEAVVQRLPDYVDPTGNTARTHPVTDGTVTLTNTNRHFGRRFLIVSFRWLTPDEI